MNARKTDGNLKEKLHDSNQHLPWIKTVKERHGSVETSSLQQQPEELDTGKTDKMSNRMRGERHMVM